MFEEQTKEQFDQFEAVELYCPHCKMALPVRKTLLLVLPDSEIYEYRCSKCGASLGKKEEKKRTTSIIIAGE